MKDITGEDLATVNDIYSEAAAYAEELYKLGASFEAAAVVYRDYLEYRISDMLSKEATEALLGI